MDAGVKQTLFMLDPARVRQLVMNGLTNAAKFGPHEGATVELNATLAADGALLIEVLDRGRGLQGRTLADLSQEFPELPVREVALSPSRLGHVAPRLSVVTSPWRRQSSAFNRVRGLRAWAPHLREYVNVWM